MVEVRLPVIDRAQSASAIEEQDELLILLVTEGARRELVAARRCLPVDVAWHVALGVLAQLGELEAGAAPLPLLDAAVA